MALATLERLTYWYPEAGDPALKEVELQLDEGLTLVAGASGSGKSTLLRCLNGLVPHFHGGRISGLGQVAGLPIPGTRTRRLAREVGFVFQDPEAQAVYGVVEREVAFGLENVGMSRPLMAVRVEEALERMGLLRLRHRRLASLSGGERQRVALATALALGARLVVLDEPTSQLDPEGGSALLEACLALAAGGHAIVISEHRLERLLGPAGGLIVVDVGRVLGPESPGGMAARLPSTAVAALPEQAPGGLAWSLEGLTAGHGSVPVLDGVEISGRQGEVTVLQGANGSGKTTLLRTIAGLLPPLRGTVERRPGRIAYLPQNPQDVLHLPTVRQELELTIQRTRGRDDADRILARLALTGLAERYPRDLSSGERQRAAIAAIIAGGPALALLDEPTRGMDAAARRALAGLIGELRDQGSSVVLATHDVQLAEAVADRVIELAAGRALARAGRRASVGQVL